MLHGIALGGGALLALAAALFALYLLRERDARAVGQDKTAGPVVLITAFTAVMTWLTTLMGAYIVFPLYRMTPPEGTTDLARFPRALILADPETEWLHRFAMETKEHVPFIAAILATAVAFIAWRYREAVFCERPLQRMSALLLGLCFATVAYVSLLGVFVNKVAPLE
jgi:hypothetical protein